RNSALKNSATTQWRPEAGAGGGATCIGGHRPHGVTLHPLHEQVSCKASRRSPQDGSDLRIEHNGSESYPLCSIRRSDPFCGDRRRGCHQVLPH
ncbi:unnamed protein product, partial [Staurois parvus]